MHREIENTAPQGMQSIRSKVLRVWELFQKLPRSSEWKAFFALKRIIELRYMSHFPKDAEHPLKSFGVGGTFSKVPAVFAPLWVLPSPFMRREIENTAPQGCEASGQKFCGFGSFFKSSQGLLVFGLCLSPDNIRGGFWQSLSWVSCCPGAFSAG